MQKHLEIKNKVIAEDEYAYDVTLRLARMLISHSAKVYLIIISSMQDEIHSFKIPIK